MSVAECKLRILYLYEYSTFHLGVAYYSLMIEISFISSVQTPIPDGAGLVCGEKSGVSCAEFYKHCVLLIEISGLMHLSWQINLKPGGVKYNLSNV